jgi:hypothetical protein
MPFAPRRARLSAGAALAAFGLAGLAALTACSGTGSSDGRNTDGAAAPSDGAVVSPAPPGKYRTLPQPCTAVDLDSLHKLVPGAKDYSGTEALTYDTDRLVGCTWKGATSDGTSRTLTLNLTRVVSYDPSISDELQAQNDFDRRASAASIPSTPPSGSATTTTPSTPSTTPPATASGTDPTATSAGTHDAGNPAGTPSGTTTGTSGTNNANSPDSAAADLAPRRLADVGNAAFINDVAKSPKSGPTRTVTVVFRAANVLATITYTQSAPRGAASPSSADLQKDAEKVAVELQHKVEG